MTPLKGKPITLQEESLVNLYIAASSEMRAAADTHNKRVNSFQGLLVAIYGSILFGMYNSSEWYHVVIVGIGMVASHKVLTVYEEFITGMYNVFIENASMRAKYEQILGLTKPFNYAEYGIENGYWESDPIVPSRHIEFRSKYAKSQDFVDKLTKTGRDQERINEIVRWVKKLGAVLAKHPA